MLDHDGQIFNRLIEFFEEDNWTFQWVEGTSALTLDTEGENGRWTCYAQAFEARQQLIFYSVLPQSVPVAKRAVMAEFITRANYGMILGCFEMDYEDGEVRFRTSIDTSGDELTPPLIRQVVYANLVVMDRYFAGLMRVIYSDDEPEAIIDEIETDPFDDDDDEDDDDLLDDDDDYGYDADIDKGDIPF